MRLVFVIANGEMGDGSFLASRIREHSPAGIVCADGGARHIHALGRVPDVVVGDLDSLDPDIAQACLDRGSRVVRHARDKNETDTQLAIEEAVALSAEEIWVFGALGNRLDHTLANLSLLVLAADRGVRARLLDEWCEAFLVRNPCTIEGQPGQTVSLLPLSRTVTGITLEGFAYPLANAAMEMGRPYGVSNILRESRGRISLASGILVAVRFWNAGRFPSRD